MAAELDMTTGRAAIAYTGAKPWHGEGVEMQEGQPIEDWIVQAGLDWEVKSSDVTYSVPGEAPLFIPDVRTFQDRKVLYRSDAKTPLAVVSKDFKVVQPKEVVEFFRDLVERHDMKLSTAGSLFGGRKFWALADLGKEIEIVNGDVVKGNLLLTTAIDGSLKTTAKFVSTRVVCNNTLTIALGENTKNVVAVSHRSEWDPDAVKVNLGLLDQGWVDFITNMRKLASKKSNDQLAKEFYQDLIFDKKREEPARAELRKVDKLMEFYRDGIGAEMGKDTYWNVLNSVTQMFTHGTGRKDPSAQLWDSEVAGLQCSLKEKALAMALTA